MKKYLEKAFETIVVVVAVVLSCVFVVAALYSLGLLIALV